MKGNYTKPLFAMEMFSTTQSMARDCNGAMPADQVNANNPYDCKWDLGNGITVFMTAYGCVIEGSENAEYGCYNNPSEGNYSFRS